MTILKRDVAVGEKRSSFQLSSKLTNYSANHLRGNQLPAFTSHTISSQEVMVNGQCSVVANHESRFGLIK